MMEQWVRAGYHHLSHRLDEFDVLGDRLEVTRADGSAGPALRRDDAVLVDGRRQRSHRDDQRRAARGSGRLPCLDWDSRWSWPGRWTRWSGSAATARPTPTAARARLLGRYTASVEDLHTPYARPQENGQRLDVDWAVLTGPGASLRISGPADIRSDREQVLDAGS